MVSEWVLVGRFGQDVKVFGPFAESDDAREFANMLGVQGVRWEVTALRSPVPDAP